MKTHCWKEMFVLDLDRSWKLQKTRYWYFFFFYLFCYLLVWSCSLCSLVLIVSLLAPSRRFWCPPPAQQQALLRSSGGSFQEQRCRRWSGPSLPSAGWQTLADEETWRGRLHPISVKPKPVAWRRADGQKGCEGSAIADTKALLHLIKFHRS